MRSWAGVMIYADGRVDKVKTETVGMSTISRTLYTLVYMNQQLQALDPDTYNNLPTDTDCPPLLQGALLNPV